MFNHKLENLKRIQEQNRENYREFLEMSAESFSMMDKLMDNMTEYMKNKDKGASPGLLGFQREAGNILANSVNNSFMQMKNYYSI